ncbi:hypothetical protein SLS63_011125 [Diaporthe eres]|uniref:Monooxygenase n=1 Tax=Diaporthe eres TaxID=83184 RepID=A0ABR1NUX7_DIAER
MDPTREDAIYNERQVKIYEKNPSVGGTWFENRYPGCACDVPSHNYVYSFEPKADFTSVYAGSDEILTYFEGFVQKYSLDKYIRLSHIVEKTTWVDDGQDGRWEVVVKDLTTGQIHHDWCHVLVHATGYLNAPAWPQIPGLDEYEGTKVHSANYDPSISLAGRDVLLVGAGSSAVQILPAIQPIVKSVTIFIRSPTWVLPDISTEAGQYKPEEIEAFVESPQKVLDLRRENERTMNSIFSLYLKDSVLQEQCKTLLESEIKKMIDDEAAEDKMIPKFAVGCKRVIPSGFRYLRALKEDNVRAVYSGVRSFTRRGVISDSGSTHEGDVAICATGFNTSHVSRYPIYGPSSRNLQIEWAESIMGYMGVGISEFPNTFTSKQYTSSIPFLGTDSGSVLGPYTPVSNGPTLIAIEAQADYICSFIDRYQTEPSIHSFYPKAGTCADFKAHVNDFMVNKAVWADNCRNSHNNHSIGGRVPTTWPGSTLHYLEAMREVRWEDWEFRHNGNRFTYLGNGISQTEWDATADLGYYIKDGDDGMWNSRWRRNAAVNKSGSMPPRELHRQSKLRRPSTGADVALHVASEVS